VCSLPAAFQLYWALLFLLHEEKKHNSIFMNEILLYITTFKCVLLDLNCTFQDNLKKRILTVSLSATMILELTLQSHFKMRFENLPLLTTKLTCHVFWIIAIFHFCGLCNNIWNKWIAWKPVDHLRVCVSVVCWDKDLFQNSVRLLMHTRFYKDYGITCCLRWAHKEFRDHHFIKNTPCCYRLWLNQPSCRERFRQHQCEKVCIFWFVPSCTMQKNQKNHITVAYGNL